MLGLREFSEPHLAVPDKREVSRTIQHSLANRAAD